MRPRQEPPPKPAPLSRRHAWALGLLLLSATFLAYQPAWNGQPVWDDAAHLTKPALRSAAGLGSIWTQLGATQQYYPLVHTVFWVQYRLWGDSTAGYHLLNILLHAASALLLVAILRRLAIRGAWLAGGIFALHPVLVESVAWITELKNTLSGVLLLAAALTYLKFDVKRQLKHYAPALLLFLLGLLAKSVIAILPAALLVVFWWMRGRISWKRDVLPLVPFFAVGIAAGLFTAWVERRFIGAQGSEFNFTLLERCLIAGRALWFYLYKLLWPAQLVFIYPRWHIDTSAVWQYPFPLAAILVTVLFWLFRRRSRAPLAVLLCFAIALFPALGFFNVYPFRYSFVADHFQYLACIAPIAAAAATIARGTDRLQDWLRWPVRLPAYGMLLAVLSLLTWNQSRMYRNAEALYRTTVARNPDCWMAHTHLGLLLMDSGRQREALPHLLRALDHHPDQADAHSNLGLLLTNMGRSDEAMAHLRKALQLDPNHADAYNNLGLLLASVGRLDEALSRYQTALDLDPHQAKAHYNLADLLATMGRNDEAVAHYRTALELDPYYADAYNNLGLLLAKMERPDEAVALFRKALQLAPNHANAHNNLGVMLGKMGRSSEAIAHYLRALEIDPLETSHLENLVVALVKRGQWRDALAALQDALALARSRGDEARAKTIADSLARLNQAVNAAKATSSPHVQ